MTMVIHIQSITGEGNLNVLAKLKLLVQGQNSFKSDSLVISYKKNES